MGASLEKLEARVDRDEWLAAMPGKDLTSTPVHSTSCTFYGRGALQAYAAP
jgi:hypothetical protein